MVGKLYLQCHGGYKHGLDVLYLLAGIPRTSQGHLTEKLERKRVEPGLQLNTAGLVDTGVSLLYLLCLLWSLVCEDLVTLLLPSLPHLSPLILNPMASWICCWVFPAVVSCSMASTEDTP